jgi:protein TonB
MSRRPIQEDAKLDDLVFENRNKFYGAYPLRKSYPERLTAALVTAVFSLMALVSIPLFYALLQGPDPVAPPAPKPQIDWDAVYGKPAMNAAAPQEPSSRILIRSGHPNSLPSAAQEEDPGKPVYVRQLAAPPALEGSSVLQAPPLNPAPVANTAQKEEEEFYDFPEEEAVFPGGETACRDYISRNFRYPAAAREGHLHGRVLVSVYLDENGGIAEVKILKGLGYGIDNELTRVIRNMPQWKPAAINGRAVGKHLMLQVAINPQN